MAQMKKVTGALRNRSCPLLRTRKIVMIICLTVPVLMVNWWGKINSNYSFIKASTRDPVQSSLLEFASEQTHDQVSQNGMEQMKLKTTVHKVLVRSARYKNANITTDNINSCKNVDDYNYLDNGSCSTANEVTFIYYNSLGFERWVCGHIIQPQSFISLNFYCANRSRLFPRNPASTTELENRYKLHDHSNKDDKGNEGADLNFIDTTTPIYIQYQAKSRFKQQSIMTRMSTAPLKSKRSPFQCDVHCRLVNDIPDNVVKARILQTPFIFWHSMEGPGYYPVLRVNTTMWQQNLFYATTSLKSEVPLLYFQRNSSDIRKAPSIKFNETISKAVFIAGNCLSVNKREQLVLALQEAGLEVDSVGSCVNNAEWPSDIDKSNKDDVMRRYKLYLAFENHNWDDYITEKFWGPLLVGALPVYYGAPNIAQRAPHPRSYIAVRDFSNSTTLAAYLNEVMRNETLFNSYFEWRKEEPERPEFVKYYTYSQVHSSCRMCRFAYARRHGLGWLHEKQEIVDLRIKRDVAVDDATGLISRPFVEKYDTSYILRQEASTESEARHVLEIEPNMHRTVTQNDGVIDIVVTLLDKSVPTTTSWTAEFVTPLTNNVKLITEPVPPTNATMYMLQNDTSRFTLVSSPGIIITHNMATLHLSGSKLPLHIRVIVEDIDIYHQGAENVSTYFGQLAAHDFLHPVELYALTTN